MFKKDNNTTGNKIVLPRLNKIKKEWQLNKLFYKSATDPQIERDLKQTEQAYKRFAKKYRAENFTNSIDNLHKALLEYDSLFDTPGHKPAYYFSYRIELNANDHEAEGKLQLIDQRLTKAGNQILFFELAIAAISKSKQTEFLNTPKLQDFKFILQSIFQRATHTLTEKEEQLLNLKSLPARSMWIAGTEKILNKKTISHKGKEESINGALMRYMDLPHTERHVVWNKIASVLEEVAPVAENELNALITDKKISDELRGYKKPYSATALNYDHDTKSIENLIEVVSSTGYKLAHDFYKSKKKLLGKEITFIDRDDGIGRLPEIKLDIAIDMTRSAFYEFNPIYGDIFDEMLTNGQIDIYPRNGKGGGAFCSSGLNTPTMVFLNHNNGLDGLRTLAHEMGHAIHAYRSKQQPLRYQGHSIATAETASTLFESVVARQVLETLTGKEKLIYLNKLISDDLKTMVMCIARFAVELEFHNTVRTEGAITWQQMRTLYMKHMKNYVGPAVTVRSSDGLHFVYKTHYRMNFYQYTYSFGNIASSLLYKNYIKDSSYSEKIDSFLSAGNSASVNDIFRLVGINTKNSKMYEEGLGLLKDDIQLFKKLSREYDKK